MYKNEGPCPRIRSSLGQTWRMPQLATLDTVAEHLHTARMSTYMTAAMGDTGTAVALYLWNTRISAALYETLSITEVIFRNAVDEALKSWNPTRGNYPAEWTMKPAAPLNSLVSKALTVAKTNAATARSKRLPDHPRKHAPITHDDIIAQLTFGTYARLMPTLNENDHAYDRRLILWHEALEPAFRGRAGEDHRVHAGRVARLHALRNRIAHAEPVLSVNFKARVRDMVRLVDSINPMLSGWVSGTTRVHDVLTQRPEF